MAFPGGDSLRLRCSHVVYNIYIYIVRCNTCIRSLRSFENLWIIYCRKVYVISRNIGIYTIVELSSETIKYRESPHRSRILYHGED